MRELELLRAKTDLLKAKLEILEQQRDEWAAQEPTSEDGLAVNGTNFSETVTSLVNQTS